MKKVFLASAGIAATLLGAGSAAQAATGFVGASYTRGNVDSGGSELNTNGYGVGGAVNFGMGSGLDIQVDASYADSEDGEGVIAGAVHLFGRGESNAFGGYVAALDSDGISMWGVGAEFNGYMENTTFATSLGYNAIDGVDGNALTAAGELRYFANDNLRLDVGAGFMNLDFGGGAESDGFSWGLGGEWQLSSAPISVFGGVTQLHLNDVSATVTGSTIGVRYNFGGSLKERDRTGPSQGVSTAPNLVNAF